MLIPASCRQALEQEGTRTCRCGCVAVISWLTDTLAVGGSFAAEQVEHLAGELTIRAVIDMRSERCDDARALSRAGVRFLHLPTPDHHPPSVPMLERGIAFADTHLSCGERVYIHCEHGIGRSALMALCILVAGGLDPLDALKLAKSRRAIISPSPAQYEGWSAWLETRGRCAPGFEDFALVAYAGVQRC